MRRVGLGEAVCCKGKGSIVMVIQRGEFSSVGRTYHLPFFKWTYPQTLLSSNTKTIKKLKPYIYPHAAGSAGFSSNTKIIKNLNPYIYNPPREGEARVVCKVLDRYCFLVEPPAVRVARPKNGSDLIPYILLLVTRVLVRKGFLMLKHYG